MAETWPAALTQLINTSGFSHAIGPTAVRSENEIGPAKVRRRFTKSIDTFSVSINMNYNEYTDLYNFWDVTLAGGVKKFNFPHPFTNVVEEFRMINPPRITPLARGGREFLVSMEWELIPS